MKILNNIAHIVTLVAFIVTTLYYLKPKTFNTDSSDLIYGSLVCIVNLLICIYLEIKKNNDQNNL
jgi:hypothetical protein